MRRQQKAGGEGGQVRMPLPARGWRCLRRGQMAGRPCQTARGRIQHSAPRSAPCWPPWAGAEVGGHRCEKRRLCGTGQRFNGPLCALPGPGLGAAPAPRQPWPLPCWGDGCAPHCACSPPCPQAGPFACPAVPQPLCLASPCPMGLGSQGMGCQCRLLPYAFPLSLAVRWAGVELLGPAGVAGGRHRRAGDDSAGGAGLAAGETSTSSTQMGHSEGVRGQILTPTTCRGHTAGP